MIHENDDLDLPPKLGDALRRTYEHRVSVPPICGQFLRTAAEAHLAPRGRVRSLVRWGVGAAAALAAVFVVVVSMHRPAPTKAVAKGDVNADGRVNIVDALALARRVADRAAGDKAWDVNGDGAVDGKDVDAIAVASVGLKQGGVAGRTLPTMNQLGLDAPRVADRGSSVSLHVLAHGNPESRSEEARQ